MTWNPADGQREVAEAAMPPVLRIRCELLLLRMRIEQMADSLPDTSLAPSAQPGRALVRLWGLVSTVPPMNRRTAETRVRQVQRIYELSSKYLHSRRAAIVPSPTEMAAWTASVDALEELMRA